MRLCEKVNYIHIIFVVSKNIKIYAEPDTGASVVVIEEGERISCLYPWDKAKECEMEEFPMIRTITYIRIISPHR